MIDSQVYDVTKFQKFHPGGRSVLYDRKSGKDHQVNLAALVGRGDLAVPRYVAGKDVTDVFFQLHRTSVLDKPAYKRLVIGTIEGQATQFTTPAFGTLSAIPYAVSSVPSSVPDVNVH